jgi:ABC-type dipeptide/oligopeptide/nickel transport system permease component
MIRYVLKRLGAGVLTVWVLATATFALMHAVPGDPLARAKALNPQIRENLRRQYGLDRPVLVQYGVYMANMVRGDFGISFTQQNRSVNDIIRKHFPNSAALGLLSLCFATLGGLLFGAAAARARGRFSDGALMAFAIVGIAVPSFVFATLIQWLLTVVNRSLGYTFLPVGGWGTLRHMLVPALVLGLGELAFLSRLTRSSLLEVIHQDYVRTAVAKGLPPRRIFFSHQLRNAILPVVTILGPAIADITTGGFVVENVFAIPGLGRYFVQAVQQLDYTVIMGLTVFYGAFLVLMVIATDILYGLVDPRISVSGERA